MNKTIILDTKEKQKIYLNATRQEIIRIMQISGTPMTPKDISNIIGISSSSIKHHIDKLEFLGLVEESHTKLINGISAKYYKLSDAIISLGLTSGEDTDSQIAYLQNEIQGIFQRLMAKIQFIKNKDKTKIKKVDGSDVISGIMHLTDEESKALSELILSYGNKHKVPTTNTKPREYAFIINIIEQEK